MDLRPVMDAICRAAAEPGAVEPFEDALSVLPELIESDEVAGVAYARHLREAAMDRVVELGGDVAAAERCVRAAEGMLRLCAPLDFDSYCLFMEWRRPPEKRFYAPRRHVLFRKVVRHLQALADGLIVFLSISLPPRVGKSTLCIFFLTWLMGRDPLSANLMSGHSDKLTKGFHQEALDIITSPEYRFGEVFPDAPFVDKSYADETISLKRKSRFPTLTCRSVDGTLTGAVEVGRSGLLYCDDLVSDREEALSSERMEKLYSAYLNQLRDRKLDGARELHVGTRWAPNDPIGRIEEDHEGDPRYRFVRVPALGPDGETQFDYMYGLGFSTSYYEDMRDALESAGEGDSWSAKYMGDPVWMGGLTFPREDLLTYSDLPEGEPDAVVSVCDTKDKGKDYEVAPVAYVYGERYYIHDVVCDNSLPEVVEPKVVDAYVRHGVQVAQFESNSAGGRVADDVARECRERGLDVDVRKKFSTDNKETRIIADSLWIKRHCYFREDEPTRDYRAFMSMLTHYTTEGKNAHDDAPDAMSMLKRFVAASRLAKLTAVRRPL